MGNTQCLIHCCIEIVAPHSNQQKDFDHNVMQWLKGLMFLVDQVRSRAYPPTVEIWKSEEAYLFLLAVTYKEAQKWKRILSLYKHLSRTSSSKKKKHRYGE